MKLSAEVIRRIRDARNILIVPFPSAMWGGDRSCIEEQNRLDTTVVLWDQVTCYSFGMEHPHILCVGGLPNHNGLTLAKSMARDLIRKNAGIFGDAVIGEEQSTHTGELVRLMRDPIVANDYDLVFVVSNWWHLRGILRLMKNTDYPMPVIGIASPTTGSVLHRLSRAIQESVRYLMIRTIDPQGAFFDRDAERRKQEALTN